MMDLSKIEIIWAKHFTPGRGGKKVELIVLHTMEAPRRDGTARNVARFFATNAPASAHYCVDNKEVIQCVPLANQAWQCRNANHNGVGIEHAGNTAALNKPGDRNYVPPMNDADWADGYSTEMLELSAQLSAALCAKFGIPAQEAEFKSATDPTVVKAGFVKHSDVPLHGTHSDPGPHFPLARYLERVRFHIDGGVKTDEQQHS